MTYQFNTAGMGGSPGLRYNGAPASYGDSFASWNTPTLAPADYTLPVPGLSTMGVQTPQAGPISSLFQTGLGTPNAAYINSGGAPGPAAAAPGWVQNMRDWGVLGQTDKNGIYQQGWGGLALGAAQGLGSLYLGMQQYNLAKDSLAASKAQFERNFANQVKTTNTNLEDRQRARVASNGGAYESVDSYMNKNRVG
jgi:hypothetical protein